MAREARSSAPNWRGLVRREPSQAFPPRNQPSSRAGRASSPAPVRAETVRTVSNGSSSGETAAGRSDLLHRARLRGAHLAASMARRSSSVRGCEPSQTNRASSASRAACSERATPRASMASPASRMPAVSVRRSSTRPTRTGSSTVSRVVPAMSVTMTRS